MSGTDEKAQGEEVSSPCDVLVRVLTVQNIEVGFEAIRKMLTRDAARQALEGAEHDRWLWAVPVLLALFVNLNVLANGFGLDDEQIVPSLGPPVNGWSRVLTDQLIAPALKQSSDYYRPVINLSYLLDFSLWGYKPFGYHLSIWLAHILNTVLVFFLAKGLLSNRARSVPQKILPLVAASLFAVHPAHAEAVAWIAGRSDVFCGTFILVSMVLYIRSGQNGSWQLSSLSMLAFILALLTKETAVGLVPLFVLYDYLSQPKTLTRENAIRWLIPALILGIYFWMRNTGISTPSGGIVVQELIPFEAVLGMITVLSFYLKLMLFPYPLHPFIIAFTASSLFLKFAVVVCVALAGFSIWALIRREVVLSFGLFWALIFLGPAVLAGVFGISITPLAERYVYIPSVGFLIASVGWLLQGLERIAVAAEKQKIKVWVTACLIVITIVGVWGRESWSRNAVWRSPVTFWEAAVAASPETSLPYLGLGAHYTLLGRYTEAESLYQRAISLAKEGDGQDALASGYMYLAELYFTQGKFSQAEPLYRDAVRIWQRTPASNPSHLIIALHNLAMIYANQKRYGEAELLYRGAIAAMEKTSSSDLPKGLYSLAKLYEVQGRYAEAEPLYRRSLTLREQAWGTDHPAVAFSLRALADLYRNEARYAEAEPLYRQSLASWEKTLGPEHPELATTLESYADLLRKMKQDSKADQMEARATEIRNNQSREHP